VAARSRAAWLLTVALAAAACSGRETVPAAGPSPSAGAPGEIDRTTPLPDPLPDIAAQVNGHAIPIAFVSLAADQIRKGRNSDEDRRFAYRQAVQQLIVRELLVEEALARGLSADDARVQQAYNEARLRHRDEDDWATFLANEGLTRDAFRAQIRAQLTAQALIDQEAARVPSVVTDDEARAFYDANPALFESGEKLRVSHILLRVAPGATAGRKAALRAEAQGILRRLRKGASFAALARELSDDKASAERGGEMPAFGHGQVDPTFEKAAFALEAGEVSDVVETPFGFHIIKLIERRPSVRQDYAPIAERIKQYVLLSRRQQGLEKLVGELRARAKIETYL
jgi:peptidyl-prolyl cis-trans isomerase C